MYNDFMICINIFKTFIGSFCGSLSSLKAHELGSVVIKEVLKRANVNSNEVSEVILGQVNTTYCI